MVDSIMRSPIKVHDKGVTGRFYKTQSAILKELYRQDSTSEWNKGKFQVGK